MTIELLISSIALGTSLWILFNYSDRPEHIDLLNVREEVRIYLDSLFTLGREVKNLDDDLDKLTAIVAEITNDYYSEEK